MKLISFLHLLASLCGFISFGLSLWRQDFDGYALAVGFYALGAFIRELDKLDI